MKIGYIKQFDSEEELFTENEKKYIKPVKKILVVLKKIFLIPNIIELENIIIIILPLLKNSKIKEKKLKIIIKKIRKLVYIKNIAISDFLLNKSNIMQYIANFPIKVLDGTWLWQYMMLEQIKYICEKKKCELQRQEISIFIKEKNEIDMQTIIEIAKNVKIVNIITCNEFHFKPIEDYLYLTYGIVMRNTNSKKAISKSNIIINIDYTEEEINSYDIPRKAVILNKNVNIKIKSKKFAGINCSSFKINWNKNNVDELNSYNLLNDFDENILYESLIYKNDSYKNILKQIEKDEVKIKRINWKKRINR